MADTPEAPAGGSAFTRKIGPLPLWGWMGIGLTLGLGYYFWKQNKSGSNSGGTVSSSGQTTDQSLVPQFVNQVYTQSEPPPAQTINVTTPPVQIPGTINVDVGNQTSSVGGSKTTSLANWKPKVGSYRQVNAAGQNYGEWVSTGQYSLNTIAKSHGVSADQIVQATVSMGGNSANPYFTPYVNKKDYNAKLPKGARIAFPLPGAVGNVTKV